MIKAKFRETYKILILLTFGFFLFFPVTSDAATINVIYSDGPNEGFNDPVLGAARKNAMQFAVDKLGAEIFSNVVINVEAFFDPLGGNATSAPLAGAQANTVHRDFSGAPFPDTWYPAALANSISGTDLAPAQNDILIIFNSDVDNPVVLGSLDWDYGLNAIGDINFVTVAMHEVSHGLGFFGTIAADGSWEILNTPSIYDRNLVYNNVGSNLINLDSTNNATRSAAVTSTFSLLWDGANVTAKTPEKLLGITLGRAEMYAPAVYQDGSSVSHFSDNIFPFEIMAPFYAIPNHDLDWTLALFEDIGWTLTINAPPPPPPPGVDPFIESGGMVVIEAENYENNISGSTDDWVEMTTQGGFSGSGYMETVINNGDAFNTGYAANSPELKYWVNFTTTGTYFVWVRGCGPSGADDSVHAGIDGLENTTANRIQMTRPCSSFTWTRDRMGNTPDATVTVGSPSVRQLNLWMREDGSRVDKIILTTDNGFTPTGAGPVESPQENDPPPQMFTLNVLTNGGTGTGNVTSNPAGINCGADCTEDYLEGTIVELTAAADAGSEFAGWSGDCSGFSVLTNVTMTSNKNCTATFDIETPPPPGSSGPFIESGGMVVIEAENFDDNVSGSTDDWVEMTTQAGFSGSGYMESVINDGNAFNTGYAANSPELNYLVNFVTTGTYFVWVRGCGPSGADDSVHAGIDGLENTTANRIQMTRPCSSFTWTRIRMGNTPVARVTVGSAGVREVNLWMREDGSRVDKIILTTNASFIPVGEGPAESLREPPPGGTGPFLETGGMVVMETENYDDNVSGSTDDWVEMTTQAGFSGSGYMESVINDGDAFNTGYVANSPELKYLVNFTTTGTYFVWVRGCGPSGADDSVHAGIDGLENNTANRIQMPNSCSSFTWRKKRMGGAADARVTVGSAGVHEINLWMREDGSRVDRILLTTSSSFTPTGEGPPESFRDPGS